MQPVTLAAIRHFLLRLHEEDLSGLYGEGSSVNEWLEAFAKRSSRDQIQMIGDILEPAESVESE